MQAQGKGKKLEYMSLTGACEQAWELASGISSSMWKILGLLFSVEGFDWIQSYGHAYIIFEYLGQGLGI